MPEAYSKKPAFRPLDNSFRFKPKGQFLLKPEGSEFWQLGGDYDEFKITPEIEENEVYSNEYPEKTLALTDLTTADLTISFTARMMTPFLRRISMLSSETLTYSQLAAAAVKVTKTIPLGAAYQLPHRDLSAVAVKSTGGSGVAFAEGEDFEADGATGLVTILKTPATVNAVDGAVEVEITYSAPAITGRKAFGPMSKTDIRAAVMFRQKVKWGPQVAAQFWIWQGRPDGDIPLGGDGEDFGTMGFNGKVIADPTKPAGFELGQVVDIPRA